MFDKIKCPGCGTKSENKLDIWQTHIVCDYCELKFTIERITDTLVYVYLGWAKKTPVSMSIIGDLNEKDVLND